MIDGHLEDRWTRTAAILAQQYNTAFGSKGGKKPKDYMPQKEESRQMSMTEAAAFLGQEVKPSPRLTQEVTHERRSDSSG